MLANVMVFVWWVRMNEEEPCTQFYNSTFLRRNILVPAPFFFFSLFLVPVMMKRCCCCFDVMILTAALLSWLHSMIS